MEILSTLRTLAQYYDDGTSDAAWKLFAAIASPVIIITIAYMVIRDGVKAGVRKSSDDVLREEQAKMIIARQVASNSRKPLPPPDRVYPSTDLEIVSRPGLYRVCGVDKETGVDATDYIRAMTADNAKVKSELRGMVVTSVVMEKADS
jgi:hypothetical protein